MIRFNTQYATDSYFVAQTCHHTCLKCLLGRVFFLLVYHLRFRLYMAKSTKISFGTT